MKLRGILFDMDGTLGDTLPICVQALQDTLARFTAVDYSEAEIYGMFGPTEEGVLMRRIPAPEFQPALHHYLERYTTLHQSAQEPFPGVIALLADLKRQGVRIGVVTGKGRGSAEISMQAMGLAPYIETLITGHPSGAEKPTSIRAALREWELPPETVAYVGDMPYDMQAAREAGVVPLGAAWAASATVKDGDGAAKVFYRVADLARWLQD